MMENWHLLLVGTDAALGAVVQDWCRSKGFHLAIATTSEDASRFLSERDYPVLIADTSSDASLIASLILSLQRNPGFPSCILLLESSDLSVCQQMLNGGMIFRCLFKPCRTEDVHRALADALNFQHLKAGTQGVAERLQRLSFSWQSRYEEKSREVALQAKRLQITQVLFDTLPSVILGISLDGSVVEANEQARSLFDERGLIGCSIGSLLPGDAQALINKCLGGGGTSTASFSLTLRGNLLHFQCITFHLSGVIQGCLLYGGSKS